MRQELIAVLRNREFKFTKVLYVKILTSVFDNNVFRLQKYSDSMDF